MQSHTLLTALALQCSLAIGAVSACRSVSGGVSNVVTYAAGAPAIPWPASVLSSQLRDKPSGCKPSVNHYSVAHHHGTVDTVWNAYTTPDNDGGTACANARVVYKDDAGNWQVDAACAGTV